MEHSIVRALVGDSWLLDLVVRSEDPCVGFGRWVIRRNVSTGRAGMERVLKNTGNPPRVDVKRGHLSIPIPGRIS